MAGHREMFEVIVRRYNPRLYRVGMAYLRNHAQVEDCMQNAYLKAFLNLKRFHGEAAFSTWLTRIMINECLMLLRSLKRQRIELFEVVESVPDDSAPAESRAGAPEIKAVLESGIATLPRIQRAVYLLRDVQQLSVAETARCLGLTPSNVKVSLHRARAALKKHLLQTAAGLELFAYGAEFCDPLTAAVMRRLRTV